MKTRLKLYNEIIYTYLEKKDKEKLRKIAFKNKKTISQFNRSIIKLIIKLDEAEKLNKLLDANNKELLNLINNI